MEAQHLAIEVHLAFQRAPDVLCLTEAMLFTLPRHRTHQSWESTSKRNDGCNLNEEGHAALQQLFIAIFLGL